MVGSNPSSRHQPLKGCKVVEFTHMVMGPTCGLVLADMGADVIKIEPIEGDRTRQLMGAGTGFFPMFNRNKRNLLLDLKQAEGVAIAKQLCLTADIVAENFKSGVMAKYGLDYAQLSAQNQRLIYITLKGFLPGPYAHRTALDEVVQMMGGLAYMTGRPGDPLRAGTSVNDIMGGMFGAIGALGALIERGISGKGQEVQSALFENNIFLVGQHMMQYAMTGQAPSPMPSRISPWAIYDVFTVKNNEQIFLAAVSDGQWQTLCTLMQWADLLANSAYLSNNDRVAARPILLEEIRNRLKPFLATELAQLFESAGLPFAPINRPEDLLDDPHLNQTGGLMPVVLSDGPRAGETVKTTLLPFTLDGQRLGVRLNPPRMGEHSNAILTELGFSQTDIDGLLKRGVVA
jgi:crotonobetainyl-CoA:carnitine CoA-transferase CaiB-like acyl-CoA transferase